MESIATIQFVFPTEQVEQKIRRNDRGGLLNELYQIYATAQDEKNRINYYRYIRVRHPAALAKKEEYYKFKYEYRKAILPEHVKYQNLIKKNSYVWWGRFSHLKGEDGLHCLQVMISETRDIINRKGNVISYILGASGKLGSIKTLTIDCQ